MKSEIGFMLLVNIALLLAAAAIAWWLSGFDPQVTGEDTNADFSRRAIRCVVTFVLAMIFFKAPSILGILILPVTLGLLWRSCLSELLSRGFNRLVDSDDRRGFDLNQSARNVDMVASLIKNGRNEEAVQLFEIFKESGDASVVVMETLLARAGIAYESFKKPRPLAEAYQLRVEGKFNEAEEVLNSQLAENPANVDAALMLMRLYAQDLRRSDRAAEVLRALEKQPDIPSTHIDYAQRSIYEWGRKKPAPEIVALPESVDELLACGYLGTAMEILEQKIAEQPEDFDLLLKLAEIHGLHCGNIHRAEKIVRKIEADHGFSAEQIETAKTKLAEWREAKPKKN